MPVEPIKSILDQYVSYDGAFEKKPDIEDAKYLEAIEIQDNYLRGPAPSTLFMSDEAKVKQLEAGRQVDLSPVTPMAVRQLIVAQLNHRAESAGRVRTKSLAHITVCYPFTLAARIIRAVLRTVFLPLSMGVAAYQQRCYGPHMEGDNKYNIVAEDLKRVAYEWIDLVTSLLALPVGLVNTFAPNAIKLDALRRYYNGRIDTVRARNAEFYKARDAYKQDVTDKHEAWKAAHEAAKAQFRVL